MERNNLEKSVKELKQSVDKVDSRINSWWKVFWHGVMQGAGAVIGAALIFAILGFLIHVLDVIPFLGDTADALREMLDRTR